MRTPLLKRSADNPNLLIGQDENDTRRYKTTIFFEMILSINDLPKFEDDLESLISRYSNIGTS